MPPPPQHKERRQPRRRRLLTLPAVCPCESIAPAPLLASLVSLAGDVAARGADAAALPALRRCAGEAVRIAGLLLALLEALRDDDGELPVTRTAVLALSELHVALQKLRLLLGDLGRRGGRLWVLMNAELAASELRIALGSVATALDSLLLLPPPPRGGDVAELARLVRDHAWRAAARVEPDAGDAVAARSVRSVLARFAGGATPDADDAWRALRSVGIAAWAGCAEEAAFLESELLDRLDEPDGEEGSDLVLLSGLLAFALYCRVVLYTRIDDDKISKKKKDDVASRKASGVAAWISPESLQCPITLELMMDPVTVATGQTYDSAAIKRWVRNNGTCPVTGERLRSADLVPNLAARAIVEQFLLSNKGVAASLHHHDHPGKKSSSKHRPAVDRTAAPFGPAAAAAARLTAALLVAKLSSSSSATSPDELLKATYEARKLTKRNAFYRSCLAHAGAAPCLLHLLGSSSSSADVQDNTVAALLNLSKHPAGSRALVESGGIGLIVDAVNVAAKAEARQNAAAVLFYLSSSPDYCDEIARVPESVPTLVRLARDGASYRARKNALVSMHGLLQRGAVHAKAEAAGAVPVLAGLLLSGSDDNDLAADAVALLERLAERAAGARAVLAAGSELVTRVVDLLGGEASSSAKEHCVALLASLGRHGGDGMLALLGKMPGLMPALYALIADDGGSARAGKKARWLVNEIHRHYEQRQPAPPATVRDRVIRV